jgi:transposase
MSKDDSLSEKQENAIELMLKGMNDSEVAQRVGVSRQWVNTWRNQDVVFIRTLRERRRMLQEVHSHQLEELVEKAIGVVRETLESENMPLRLRAAMYVLKVSGLEEFMKPEEGGGEQTVREALLEAIQEVEEELGIREG